MLARTGKWLKGNWGLAIFIVDTVAALGTLLGKVTGHYINFTAPAHYLWRGADPYGITFPGSPGAFFYSPGCALYFYGLFAFLPPILGQFLYMLLSVAIYIGGLRILLEALRTHFAFDLKKSGYANLFWLMIASELLGGIIAVKIDVLMVGGAFACVGCLIRNRGALFALFLMGIATSWKLHPVSVFGLILVPYLLTQRWKPVAAYAAGIVLGLASPLLVFSPQGTLHLTYQWLGTLHEFTVRQWLAPIFQHIYGFLFRAFGFPMDVGVTTQITAAIGLCFAVIVGIAYRRWKNASGEFFGLPAALLLALALGSTFTAVFSQLIQSNSYVVYTPLVLAVIVFAEKVKCDRTATRVLLVVCFVVVSLAYSDFNPRRFYWLVYGWGIKPLGVLLLSGALCVAALRLKEDRA
jgi:hypothetical protein